MMVRSVIVLGVGAVVTVPTDVQAQEDFSFRFPARIEFPVADSGTVRAIPPSVAAGGTYKTEGAVLGFIAGGLASYLLFQASKNQQCPSPCRGAANITVGVFLGSVVGGTLGGLIGSRMEKQTRYRRRRR